MPFHLFFLAISVGLISVYHLYIGRDGGASSLGSTLLVMLCLLPVIGLIYVFRAYAQQRDLARRNARLAVRNERLAVQAIASQVIALDLKDDYTARHTAAVAQWAHDIAKRLGLSEKEINLTHSAALLHDVGKIGIPGEVLRSSDKLDATTWALIESHSLKGHQILSQIDQFDDIATIVLYHHERYDGTGYPHGLAGEEIPFPSRIISAADAYHAMISDRPYRAGLPEAIAQAELELKRGTQFDPGVVDCFLEILRRSDKAYRLGRKADFQMEVQAAKFLPDLPEELLDEEPEPQPQQTGNGSGGGRRFLHRGRRTGADGTEPSPGVREQAQRGVHQATAVREAGRRV